VDSTDNETGDSTPRDPNFMDHALAQRPTAGGDENDAVESVPYDPDLDETVDKPVLTP
jgi:hypothetical protein